jgi:TetR/AcrR family transcriptional regulator, transcriptional repressor for nem operon
MPARPPAYRQRELLIQAGFELAEKLSPAQLTAGTLARRAGLAARSLTLQFGGLERYAETLQAIHYEETRRETLAAVHGLAPGAARILRATQAYFDFAFNRRGLRAWLSELRARSPAMQLQWRMDNQLYAQFLATELALCGWPHPVAGARLYIAGVLELVRDEQRENRRLPAARRALERFLNTHVRPSAAVGAAVTP